MRRRLTVAFAVVLGALGAGPAAAVAHPLLVTSAPAPGSILPGSPSVLTLAFSETSVPSGSAVTLSGPGGRSVSVGRIRSAAAGQQLTAKLAGKLVPGVYRVHWVALGDDGHTTSGAFAFGVSKPNGDPPPGAAAALGGTGTAGRGGDASGQSPVSVAALWIGVLAASFLWGVQLLLFALRRRRAGQLEDDAGWVRRAGTVALVLAAASAIYGALQQAGAGASGGLDLGLLTATGTGISALARAVIVAVGVAGALLVGRAGPARRGRAEAPTGAARRGLAAPPAAAARRGLSEALTGAALLVSFGLSGHVLAQHSVLAAAGMALHVLAAGTWAGGLIALVLVVRRLGVPVADAARAYAPVAVTGLGVAAVTGAIAAIREVSHWYFLWWSGYGRFVIVKVALVGAASAAGGLMAWRLRRPAPIAGGAVDAPPARSPGRRGLGVPALEASLVVLVIGAASVLSGLAQGRGQPLPAQRGDLLPGPALSSVVTPNGPASVTLAPALPGANTLVVSPRGHPRAVTVRLACGCDPRPVIARLTPHRSSGAFSASIPVPTAGTWNGYVTIDGHPAGTSVSLPVGVAGAPGAPVHNVLAIADLSGPGARRCTSYLVGAQLAIGRLNGSGGVDGGDKLALAAYDDGGSAARAGALARSALAATAPVAVLPCGAGAEPAVTQASRAGVPTLEGDPAINDVAGNRVFRVAADPYADGVALAQTIRSDVLPVSARGARTVKVLFAGDEQGQRRLAGFRAGLEQITPALRIDPISDSALTHAGAGRMLSMLDRTRTVALVLDVPDAQAPGLASAIGRLPASRAAFKPAPVIASERLLSEGFVEAAGSAGRIGVVQGTSTVAVDSRDGLLLSQAIPALFPGQSASLEALRGYVAGLALDYGVGDGTSSSLVAARLLRPTPFTDAIAEPWRSDAPAAGAQRLTVLDPTFLPTTLLPVSSGGEAYSGQYFPNGAWQRPTTQLFGPAVSARVPPLGAP
jgi:methionine-rich copper-binding protein CopC/putative copper export protein